MASAVVVAVVVTVVGVASMTVSWTTSVVRMISVVVETVVVCERVRTVVSTVWVAGVTVTDRVMVVTGAEAVMVEGRAPTQEQALE